MVVCHIGSVSNQKPKHAFLAFRQCDRQSSEGDEETTKEA